MINTKDNAADIDLLWGAARIGRAIGRTPRQVNYMLEAGLLPPAKKIGNRWVASRRALDQFFSSVKAEA